VQGGAYVTIFQSVYAALFATSKSSSLEIIFAPFADLYDEIFLSAAGT
jgi:hypothetical protein